MIKIKDLKNSIIQLDQKLNELTEFNSSYATSISTINNDSYITFDTVKESFSNSVTLNLDDIKNLIIIYKNHEYVVDPETLISLLFNYEEIIREIICEELNL